MSGVLIGTISISLVAGPQWWSKRLFGASAASDVPTSHFVQGVAFAYVGTLLFVNALPELADSLQRETSESGSLLGLSTTTSDYDSHWSWPTWANVIRVAMGVALFTGAAWWARLWHRMRTAGLPAAQASMRSRHGAPANEGREG